MVDELRDVACAGRTFSLATKYSHISDDWLVFLHGIGCAKECFDKVFETKLVKQYSILTFDLLGFGNSAKPEDFAYTLEQHADIAQGLIKQFGPANITLIAHSMGGTIGTILAQKLDNLVGLINAEGNLVSEDAGTVSRRTAEQAETTFVEQGYEAFLKSLRQSDDVSFQTWATWYGQSSRIAIHRSGTSLVEWSDSGKLMSYFNGLKNKAFIYGDRTDVSHLLNKFEAVKVIQIPNSGHFMMLDNPDAFYSAIASFMNSV